MHIEKIVPPWVEYPEYGLGDTFWRQSGEAWFHHKWLPYWQSLSIDKQEEYLHRWKVPEVWRKFYFDQLFQKWLEEIDE